MKWLISLASESHLQLFRNYPLVSLFPILIQWAINCKLESSMGLSDVHLNWDPLIYGDSWIEYFMIWTISNNPDCMMSMFNKSRISNSHKWLSAQQTTALKSSSLCEYFFLSPFSLLYVNYLVTVSCATALKFYNWLCMYTATPLGPPLTHKDFKGIVEQF